jgi:hypothetical protein
MKKIVKLELGVVLLSLFFAAATNVTGTILNEVDETLNIKEDLFNERQITISNSDIVINLWDEQKDNGEMLPYYSISLDKGKTYVRTVQPSYELGLRYAYFDPIEDIPFVYPTLESGTDTNLYIVQFYTQPLEEFKNEIIDLGGTVYQYIAQFAYLVEMSESIKEEVENIQYVRWIGPYHPAYRLEEYMLNNYEMAGEMYPLERYNIQVHTVEMKNILAEKISNIGGIVNTANGGKVLVQATLTPEQLFLVSRMNEVNFIDRWGDYEPDMDIGREIGGANYIETVAGFTGQGVRGESFDTGFNLDHQDFQNNPLIVHGPSCGSDSHGTACIGICFGDGTGNADARGLLPDGQGIVADYNVIGLTGQSRYDHSGELIEDPYYAVFQTASVGSPRTTQYSTISADTDSALFDFDVVHCQSQSNAGDQMSRPQAWAKNIISGGAVYHYDTIDKSDDSWNYGASIGPATDGRIKPTFCFFYDYIQTVGWPGNSDYTNSFGGTSGATPMTAGHVGLFFQMWSEGIFGNEVDPNGTVFENKAHMTTAKAALINTADQYSFEGENHDKTRMHQGWGMPNVKNLYDSRDNIYIIDESDILEPFDVSDHVVSVEEDTPALKVTMTYADTPGNPAVQSQHRINDLTLKVISPSETIYYGNYGLEESVWSSSGGSADDKNTVECVFIENPESGAWTIEIHADEIIDDTHVETQELDADYSLVVSPVLSGPEQPIIDGPTEVEIGKEYDFTFITNDPEDADVYYYIDWGDGEVEEWTGPHASGEEITVSHTYLVRGNVTLQAKAKNTYGTEGIWSVPYIIQILAPELEVGMTRSGFLRVKGFIKNIGNGVANDVNWTLTLNGGSILIGKESTGIIDSIPVDEEISFKSNIIIGFGETEFLVTAGEPFGSTDNRKQGGKMFGIFHKVNFGGD